MQGGTCHRQHSQQYTVEHLIGARAEAAHCDVRVPGSMFKTASNIRAPPRSGLHKSPPSCAVVTSAGSLNGSRCEREIDAHNIVIRINLAPTHGFEADVGRKTALAILNSNVVRSTKATLLEPESFSWSWRHMSGVEPITDWADARTAEQLCSKWYGTPFSLVMYGDEWKNATDDDEEATTRRINQLKYCRGAAASTFSTIGRAVSNKNARASTKAMDRSSSSSSSSSSGSSGSSGSSLGPRISKAFELSREFGAFHGAIPRQFDRALKLAGRRRAAHCDPESLRLDALRRTEIDKVTGEKHYRPGGLQRCLPTAGFYAVHVALALCDRVSLYGALDRHGEHSEHGSRFHYFDPPGSTADVRSRQEMNDTHDLAAEKSYYRWLASRKPVRVCHDPLPPPLPPTPPNPPPDPPAPPPPPPKSSMWMPSSGVRDFDSDYPLPRSFDDARRFGGDAAFFARHGGSSLSDGLDADGEFPYGMSTLNPIQTIYARNVLPPLAPLLCLLMCWLDLRNGWLRPGRWFV